MDNQDKKEPIDEIKSFEKISSSDEKVDDYMRKLNRSFIMASLGFEYETKNWEKINEEFIMSNNRPRWYNEKFQDAMVIVREYGRPNLTFTENAKGPKTCEVQGSH